MEFYIDAINPLQHLKWDEIVLSFRQPSVFHSRAWAQVLAESYGFKPHGLVVYRQGRPAAAWPVFETPSGWTGKKGVALPFSDHCEPLLADRDCFNNLFQGLIDFAHKHKWKTIEFRGGRSFFQQYPAVAHYHLHVVDLCRDEHKMEKQLRSSTRRNIKKARQHKIDITIDTSLPSVKAFYDLNCLTRKHHGLPPQPFSFFQKIHQHILSQDKGMVVLARHQEQMIAGAVFFHFGDSATYKYGASHRDYLALRPNNLVMWSAIKWYARRGYRSLDLGRSEPDNKGLNQFKNGWGASMKQIAYHRYDLVRQCFVKGGSEIPAVIHNVFRRLPVPVLRILGAVAYRHMG